MDTINQNNQSDTLETEHNNSNTQDEFSLFEPYFAKGETHPFDEVAWELRDGSIINEKGETIFSQKNVEVPANWSKLASNIVISKYLHGKLNSDERETSIKTMIDRVAKTIADWGYADGYFSSEQETQSFYKELCYLVVNQYAAFNSPVWFNVGIETKPQCSACFINSVEDTMQGILDLAKTEGMLFKWGSGTGTNFSSIRSSRELLSGGGTASGPVSFMRGFDAFAGVIKSGGKTRRAAKMVILNVDHPDIMEFITSKATEEKKAWALIEAGYDGGFNIPGGAYDSVYFQNANNSVRVTDAFMRAVEADEEFSTTEVLSKKKADTYKARDMFKAMTDSAHLCGDPGIQFHDTINRWNTCKKSGTINASNPCSEFMFLDDSACNLASLNLMKFRNEDGTFNVEEFKHAVRIFIIAQDIIVDNAGYPTEKIEKNSITFRPLGLGYANLGALLMSSAFPYDSEVGQSYASVITALMTAEAYKTSALLAKKLIPFNRYEENKAIMQEVVENHKHALSSVKEYPFLDPIHQQASQTFLEAIELGKTTGYRNSQVTLLAPTGTIGFMMDCDTTGVEPDLSLVKFKKLSGGGVIKIVNQSVPLALKMLGFDQAQISTILNHIEEHNSIEGAPELSEDQLAIFDCAYKPPKGNRFIHYMGHIKMMGAVQPFLSGAISKTVNMPEEVTPDDIARVYMESWKLGLKSVAIYRENSKKTSPLTTKEEREKKKKKDVSEPAHPFRRKLPDERPAITHKFSVGGHEGYLTVGMYDDGTPGELFIVMAKEGSVVSGLMDSFATAVSLALQYGVPLKVLCEKFIHTRFEPSGWTSNRKIQMAKSIMDYIFRWLADKFIADESVGRVSIPEEIPVQLENTSSSQTKEKSKEDNPTSTIKENKEIAIPPLNWKNEKLIFSLQSDAPPCSMCGEIMVRSGSCYKCLNCGNTSGCS